MMSERLTELKKLCCEAAKDMLVPVVHREVGAKTATVFIHGSTDLPFRIYISADKVPLWAFIASFSPSVAMELFERLEKMDKDNTALLRIAEAVCDEGLSDEGRIGQAFKRWRKDTEAGCGNGV